MEQNRNNPDFLSLHQQELLAITEKAEQWLNQGYPQISVVGSNEPESMHITVGEIEPDDLMEAYGDQGEFVSQLEAQELSARHNQRIIKSAYNDAKLLCSQSIMDLVEEGGAFSIVELDQLINFSHAEAHFVRVGDVSVSLTIVDLTSRGRSSFYSFTQEKEGMTETLSIKIRDGIPTEVSGNSEISHENPLDQLLPKLTAEEADTLEGQIELAKLHALSGKEVNAAALLVPWQDRICDLVGSEQAEGTLKELADAIREKVREVSFTSDFDPELYLPTADKIDYWLETVTNR